MKGVTTCGAGCAALVAWFAVTASPARAQTTDAANDHGAASTAVQTVTFTFRLTINGTPPKGDSFLVKWGETGLELCNQPCAGAGHTYRRTMSFPQGVTETFVFVRASAPVTPGHPGQEFVRQTLTANRDTTLSAAFTYGPSSVPTPATGSAPITLGAILAGCGTVLLAVFVLLGRRRFRLRHIVR
jgi:hypothetical protein